MPHKYWYCGTFDFKKVSKTGEYRKTTGKSRLQNQCMGDSRNAFTLVETGLGKRVFDTFSSTHMSLSQYRLYFFVKFEITSSTLCIVVL